ncbi:MAG: hypothetical protein ACLFQU_00320 [Candidatus Kapaibacterium sp.]
MYRATLIIIAASAILLIGCGDDKGPKAGTEENIDHAAEYFVYLALSMNKHDKDYVDSYFGPDSLRERAAMDNVSLKQIADGADSLIYYLDDFTFQEQILSERKKHLKGLLESLVARANMLLGEKYDFDQESLYIYGVVSPDFPESHFQNIIDSLDKMLPGGDSLHKRIADFRKQFIIPDDKVDAVFKRAIEESRKRTKEFIDLPENEDFTLEYVNDVPWGAYNWYQGGSKSLIQINMDFPIYIDRAIDLAAHEGYPGHHVFHSIKEKEFAEKNGWFEYTIYPLFSPVSLISEGTANFGIKVIFPGEEKMKFEMQHLFPIAGLDSSLAPKYSELMKMMARLSYARTKAAKKYYNGDMTREEAIDYMMKYQLVTKHRASKFLDFVDRYGSYIINYNYGEDLVEDYINRHGGTADNPQQRKEIFKELLYNQVLPGDLKEKDKEDSEIVRK